MSVVRSDSIAPESPDSTAATSRRKCVFTALLKRRFSRRSRSERAIRFFCDAILAMERPAARAANENRAMTEQGGGERAGEREPSGESPTAPPEPFDPSTGEFPPLRQREAERIERRHEAVSMDTSTFMAIPAPTPTTPFIPPEFDEKAGRLGRSTAFFSIATAFSRVAGLVREIVAASYFGISGAMSAFTIAFQVPNLVRSLFADAAIQAAFVPVFTEQLEKGNKREAFRLASTLLFLVTLVLGAITALFVLVAPLLIPVFAPGFGGELEDLTIALSRLLFPILIILGTTGIVVGVLNSYDRFGAFAISPL